MISKSCQLEYAGLMFKLVHALDDYYMGNVQG